MNGDRLHTCIENKKPPGFAGVFSIVSRAGFVYRRGEAPRPHPAAAGWQVVVASGAGWATGAGLRRPLARRRRIGGPTLKQESSPCFRTVLRTAAVRLFLHPSWFSVRSRTEPARAEDFHARLR